MIYGKLSEEIKREESKKKKEERERERKAEALSMWRTFEADNRVKWERELYPTTYQVDLSQDVPFLKINRLRIDASTLKLPTVCICDYHVCGALCRQFGNYLVETITFSSGLLR